MVFENFAEAIDYAHAHYAEDPGWQGRDNEWSGGSPLEAFKLAREGWPDGRKHATKLTSTLGALVGRAAKPEVIYDVVGNGGVDVGLALTGVPESFMDWQDTNESMHNRGSKVIRIGVNTFVSAGINHDVIHMRGATVVALVDALEDAGYSVEVWGIMAADVGRSKRLDIVTPLKVHGGQLQPDQLTYALAHPSFFRRHLFAIGHKAPDPFPRLYDQHKGSPWDLDADDARAYQLDLVVNSARYDTGAWRNLEAARTWLLDALGQFGVTPERGR